MKKFTFAFSLLAVVLFCGTHALGQASYISGSLSTSKTGYSPGVGANRLLVVIASSQTNNGGRTVSSISWGGRSLTFVRGQNGGTGSNDIRTEVWYLNESNINLAASFCNDFTVTWSAAPTDESFTVITLKDVDQATPIASSNGSSNTGGSNTTISSGNIAVGANDIMVYASMIQTPSLVHVPSTGYTEIFEYTQGSAFSIAGAIKTLSGASTESPTATWGTAGSVAINAVGFNGVAITAPTSYYSRNATLGGNWNDPNSWTTNSDGSGGPLAAGTWPRRNDNVTVLAGHTITVDAVTDNKSCGKTPDGLLLSNVGTFPISNTSMFYQSGDITLNGQLSVTTGTFLMTGGTTTVASGGKLYVTESIVNVGFLIAESGSTVQILDDVVLSGSSNTIINTTATSNDDLFIDHTDATLCGSGSTTLQSGPGSVLTYTNSATVSQICSSFTVSCTGGCTGFPVTGTGTSLGYNGPGGIEKTNGTGNLVLWLDANTISVANGANVTSWADQSGYTNTAAAPSGNEPRFQTNIVNGFPVVRFTAANSDYLRVADGTSLKPNTISLFVVGMYSSASTTSWTPFLIKATDDNWSNGYAITRDNTNATLRTYVTQWDANYVTGSLAANTYAVATSVYDKSTIELFVNETSAGSDIFTSNITHTTNSLLLGAGPNGGTAVTRFIDGDIAEAIIFNRSVSAAERIIIDNYLAAKYNITLAAANDFYTMDNSINGNFDYEVAGVGQASNGSNHTDSKGKGIVRMFVQNPASSLSNSEFLFWGHNNATLTSNLVDVDGTTIKERINRIWRVSETGDVGAVTVSFDMNSMSGSPAAANLRLLIDRDGDGFFDNDVTPISGATLSGKVASFANVNLQTGDRFTLGNTNLSTPLPITLTSFHAETTLDGLVELTWTTATETNNDFFSIERSKDGKNWEQLMQVKGAGTTTETQHYRSIDDGPYIGSSYYRLKQTDYDGRFTYSSVVRVVLKAEEDLVVYPNPAKGTFSVRAPFEFNETQVQLRDLSGRSVPLRFMGSPTNQIAHIDASELASGLYVVQVNDGFVVKSTRVIVK